METKSQKFLRLTEVQRRVPYSRSAIYQLASQGKFPKPLNLGARAVAWLESDIDEWIASRIAKCRALAPLALAPCIGIDHSGGVGESFGRAGMSAGKPHIR
jgi:prophage regulatory protein